MPDYLDYQKSIAAEFKAFEKRVRNLIDDRNWGEEGRYKEAVLKNYLRRVLPKNLSIGTGFVRNGDEITTQIDIIIFDNTYPLLFSEGDFVITTSSNVIGIIEVKSNILPSDLCEIVEKANRNAEIIAKGTCFGLFNGIFSYNAEEDVRRYYSALNNHDFSHLIHESFNQPVSPKLSYCVNHMSLGGSHFIKLWSLGQDQEESREYLSEDPTKYAAYYSLYKMQNDLAFSYFLSNLQECIIRVSTTNNNRNLPTGIDRFLYPIEGGKETCLFNRVYLKKS
ncbi:DUF6602 domain-containing protein [Desulfitobacterium sp. PCE1]|uniref:DUF6602 domain-containing protein n=1 Tax=Desulfitobacterium sp. PCE1 TaxID=146907 RepID=UPI00035F930D|nr:DUF6602 domain-containing protein [Desulfitobacterium sp. PCE1]